MALMVPLVNSLVESKFLTHALATSHSDDGSKWHGVSRLPNGIHRRLDLLFVPWKERGAALIYFTGNDIFNRSLRLLASKKGMGLNQRGLFKDTLRGPGKGENCQRNLYSQRIGRGDIQDLRSAVEASGIEKLLRLDILGFGIGSWKSVPAQLEDEICIME